MARRFERLSNPTTSVLPWREIPPDLPHRLSQLSFRHAYPLAAPGIVAGIVDHAPLPTSAIKGRQLRRTDAPIGLFRLLSWLRRYPVFG
jgi:hypothetical protein